MCELDMCPYCGRESLETVYSSEELDGFPLEAYEYCEWCGFEREIDMITGEILACNR